MTAEFRNLPPGCEEFAGIPKSLAFRLLYSYSPWPDRDTGVAMTPKDHFASSLTEVIRDGS